jgi:hypothetical protein
MTLRRSLVFAILGASLALFTPARASADPKSDAEKLFREGRTLYDAGSYHEACARFAESQRIDPSAGTALNLGDCYEKLGMVSSAYAAYKEAHVAAALRKRVDWEKYALERIEAIKPSVPTVTIRTPRVDGLVVTRDGQALVAKNGEIDDHPDPGPHMLEARAPGREAWSKQITIERGTTQVVEIPALAESATASPATPGATTTPARSASSQGEDTGGSWQKPTGIVIAGIGVAALAFGTAGGFVALNAKDEAAAKCPSYPDRCTQEGTDTNDRAQTWATISTIGIVAGGALLVGGAVLYFTAPSSRGTSAALRVGPSSVGVAGTF